MEITTLVKLLNEYEVKASEEFEIEPHYEFTISKDNNIKIHDTIDWRNFDEFESQCIIISKWYEFIAWLVENKYFKEYKATSNYLDNEKIVSFTDWPTINNINWQLYDSILWALAIDNNPIELLLNIMK